MCSTSRRRVCVPRRLSSLHPAARRACTFRFYGTWKIVCVLSLISSRRQSESWKGISRGGEARGWRFEAGVNLPIGGHVMSTTFKSYRDLEVWQKSMKFAKRLYQTTQSFPPDERFGLTNQLRRASVSVPSNLAEG